MATRGVDPRDIESEVDRPVYRVYFWRQRPGGGWASDEHDLTGAASVHEALAWAEANAGQGRLHVIYLRYEQTLLRLAGIDPVPFTTSP